MIDVDIDIFMTEDEAKEVEQREPVGEGGMVVDPVAGLFIGQPSVLHDLHCLVSGPIEKKPHWRLTEPSPLEHAPDGYL